MLNKDFTSSTQAVKDALQKVGFGIVSEIDLHDKFKEKLNKDFRKYKILGACNPAIAFKAVTEEEKIGTMLPCNFIIQEKGDALTEVSAINPVESMQTIKNDTLQSLAREVEGILKQVVADLS